MAPVERDVEIYQCPSCGQVKKDSEPTCCERQMETIETAVVFESPEVEEIARQVFGATSTELEICDVLMAEGEASISTLTEYFSCNRSTISRHLNHLVERGVVTKRSEELKDGGRVHVYSCIPADELRQKLEIGFYMWADEAMKKIDEQMQSKIEAAGQTDRVTTSDRDAETTTHTTGVAGDSAAELEADRQEDSLLNRLF